MRRLLSFFCFLALFFTDFLKFVLNDIANLVGHCLATSYREKKDKSQWMRRKEKLRKMRGKTNYSTEQ